MLSSVKKVLLIISSVTSRKEREMSWLYNPQNPLDWDAEVWFKNSKMKCIVIWGWISITFLICPRILFCPIYTDSSMWHLVLCLCDPLQSLISFVVFQFYVSSCSHFLQIPTLAGCWLTNFGINRAIKSGPLALHRSPSPLLNIIFIGPTHPILVNHYEKIFGRCCDKNGKKLSEGTSLAAMRIRRDGGAINFSFLSCPIR